MATTDATTPRPPATMDLWEPWLEYISLFQDRPERAAEVARDLFRTQDPRYLPFILSFPRKEDQAPQELKSGKLLVTLLDIVSNNLWYTQLRRMADPEHHDRITTQLFVTLRCVGQLLIVLGKKILQPLNAELCRQCTLQFPGLWKLLWEYKSIILTDEFTGGGGEIFDLVRYLLESYYLMEQQSHQHIPTIKSYAAHVAFYIWRHAGKPRYNAHSCARIVSSILSAQSVPDIYAFVADAVPAVVGQENPLDVFSDALLAVDKELLQPAQLERHLSLAMFVLPGTELPVGISAETRQKALYALANVFQRYQCNGDMSDAPYAPRGISQAILECFHTISLCDQHGVAQDLSDNLCDLNFLSVVVAALDGAYIPPVDLSKAHHDSIVMLLALYSTYGRHAQTFVVPEAVRNHAYLRRILQAHWLPVLNNLRSTSRLPELKTKENRDTLDKLLQVIEQWNELGVVYRFNKKSGANDRLETLISYVTPQERLQGCSLTECPCYGRKAAWHKTRRVCKGCWSAYYCSTRCQKRCLSFSLLVELSILILVA